MQRPSDWPAAHASHSACTLRQQRPQRASPVHDAASWLPGDLLILLLAVCTVWLGMGLVASPSPPAPTSQAQAWQADVQARTEDRTASGRTVTLITPLHLRAPDLPTLPGLAQAETTHAALPPALDHKPVHHPGNQEPPTALLLDETDLDALGKAITVIADDHAIRFRIASDALFPPAQAKLTPAGLATLQPLATILSRHHAPVSIEGHADAIPIRNPRYPSNWELSASRAASVLRYLEDHGVAPERLHASGYAHTRPVADNNTADGRATNRRVEIVVALPQPQ